MKYLEMDLNKDYQFSFLSLSSKKQRLLNKTQKVLKVLFPPIADDVVKFRSFLIEGVMESGKTTLLRFLAKKAIQKYGNDVNVIGSDSFEILLENMNEKLVQLLILDDAFRYQGKLANSLVASLFEIRHIYEERFNREAGIIIVGSVIQRYWALDVNLRSKINVTFFKSCPFNKYDIDALRAIIGNHGVRFLRKINREIFLRNNNKIKSFSVVKLNFEEEPGIFKSTFVSKDEDPITWIMKKDLEQREITEVSDGIETEDYIIKPVKKIDDPDFLQQIIKAFPRTFHRLKKLYGNNPFKKFKTKHLEAWYNYYSTGASLDRIAEHYGVSKSALINKYEQGGWFSIVDRELLGHLAEDALIATYFPDYKVVAGESEPDLISEDKKTIVEVKVRRRFEGPNINMLNKKELAMLEQGWKLFLTIITYAPRKCTIHIYSVEKKGQSVQKS
ncbi:MAG: ATP-binding protein [Candidatus Asgardarchaeia archaeon]